MKKLLLAALVAAGTIPVASASADPCVVWDPPPPHIADPCPYGGRGVSAMDCQMGTLAQETLTGGQDTFTGVASGYIIGAQGETFVSIECEVHVNGATQASTPAGTGTVAATTQGQVTYTAADTDHVELCSVWSTSTDSGVDCGDATSVQFPPQAVIDLLDTIIDTLNDVIVTVTSIPDPTICPVFASLAPGVPGVVDISTEGDITLPDPIGKFWDCPPYDP